MEYNAFNPPESDPVPYVGTDSYWDRLKQLAIDAANRAVELIPHPEAVQIGSVGSCVPGVDPGCYGPVQPVPSNGAMSNGLLWGIAIIAGVVLLWKGAK